MAGRPGRATGVGRGLLRAGRHDRQPVGARRRPAYASCPPRRGRRTAARGLHRRDALVGGNGGGGDGRRPARRPGGRPRPDDRRGARGGDRSGGDGRALRRGRDRGDDQRRRDRRPRRRRRASAGSTACGCTSTAPTEAPRSRASSVRDRFAGIEHADSFIVDPHKWLFAPFDSCALIYRNPELARAAHTPAGRLPRARPGQRAEPVRLCDPPEPAGARPAVLVLARRARHARLLRGDRAHARGHARGASTRSASGRTSSS